MTSKWIRSLSIGVLLLGFSGWLACSSLLVGFVHRMCGDEIGISILSNLLSNSVGSINGIVTAVVVIDIMVWNNCT